MANDLRPFFSDFAAIAPLREILRALVAAPPPRVSAVNFCCGEKLAPGRKPGTL